jgi:hypothetical protein
MGGWEIMMKTIYDQLGRYTETTDRLHEEIRALLAPKFKELVTQGYSFRDVAHLFGAAVHETELTHAMDAMDAGIVTAPVIPDVEKYLPPNMYESCPRCGRRLAGCIPMCKLELGFT